MYLKIAICDDNLEERQSIQQLLKTCSASCEIVSFSSGEEFLKNYYPRIYDLILMDIFMTGMSGVETIAKIRAVDQAVTIAFLTTSPDFTMESYQYRVDRYLLKPIKSEDLDEVLRLAMRNKKNQPEITISIRGQKQTVFLDDICYAEQSGHALLIHLTNGEILRTTMKLSDFETMLTGPSFYRCHKSFLVNLIQVSYLDNDLKAFVMNGGDYAYIRRDSLREARTRYSQFMFDQIRGKDTT